MFFELRFFSRRALPNQRTRTNPRLWIATRGSHRVGRMLLGPVRRGGAVLKLYENSLALALFLLFVMSFVLHAVGGSREYSEQQMTHGAQPVTVFQYMGTAQFWF